MFGMAFTAPSSHASTVGQLQDRVFTPHDRTSTDEITQHFDDGSLIYVRGFSNRSIDQVY